MSDNNSDELFGCKNICWMIGVVLGFAAFLLASSSFGCGVFISMLVGIAVFVVAGWALGKYFCADTGTAETATPAAPKPAETTPTPAETPKEPAKPAAPKAETKLAPVAEEAADVAVKSSLLPGEQELADRKGAYKYEAEKPAKKAPAKKATPKADDTGVAEKKPRTMKAPRKAGADDLKLLKGVGPKLEQTLNELGFYHFDQVAKWGAAEIAWVDSRLKFKGRIERDGWIDQAKILADGGETEFSKRGNKA